MMIPKSNSTEQKYPVSPSDIDLGSRSKEDARHRFFFLDTPTGWIASSSGIRKVGWLTYDDKADVYTATFHPRARKVAPVGKGKWSKEQSPMDSSGSPKGEFLTLLAMRVQYTREGKLSRKATGYRMDAIRALLKEREEESGTPVLEDVKERAYATARSEEEFEEWLGIRFRRIMREPDAGTVMSRYGSWLQTIDRLLSTPPDPDEVFFLEAVETAAKDCGAVPTSQAVLEAFYRNRSINQRGSGSTFRTLKSRMGFNWLPPGKPGPKI